MFGLIRRLFGSAQDRLLHKYWKVIQEINLLEETFNELSDDQLKAKTAEFKKRYQEGSSLDELLPEAYAVVKNVCRRLCGTHIHVSGYQQKWDMVPYDVQILAAIAMHYGCIAEMQTGEGKTLTSTMPLYLNSLAGKGVRLITVNNYLARRDSEWVGSVFRWLGLKVASLKEGGSPSEKREAYSSDILYGTASEFGFDYLRDNSMAMSADEQTQKSHFFAIIDEVDSILIDEARTPLIISGSVDQKGNHGYLTLRDPILSLVRKQRDFCSKKASSVQKVLMDLECFDCDEMLKLTKAQKESYSEACRELWLISKGMPRNRLLKRMLENPDIRMELENWDIYFYAESNRQERSDTLAELFIIVDEKSNEFELTDKGIQAWIEANPLVHEEDFVMLDLGGELAALDEDTTLSDSERIQKRETVLKEDRDRKERAHNIRQLLRATLLMEKDVDYILEDAKVVIIDENTGRPQPGRRFADGLHQAIEAKEGVSIQGDTKTHATITLQNYFRLYEKLSGMTGTAMTEAQEFKEIYELDVLAIPTHRPCIRKDMDDEIYMTEREKYNAIVKEVIEYRDLGRPVLLGTESVEVSEKLSRIFRLNHIPHTVLNAKNHAAEAEIIADAGTTGAITIATNMAGRGTDIKLKKEVTALGGLHVIGTSRHTSRRIDHQLRGRSGRLGDPGSSKFFLSFEDSLMRLFASPKMASVLNRFRPPEGEPISASILNKSIETAQKRIEQRNYLARKHTLEYDNVLNKQRSEVYSYRNEILHTEDIFAVVSLLIEDVAIALSSKFLQDREGEGRSEDLWTVAEIQSNLQKHIPSFFQKKSLQKGVSEGIRSDNLSEFLHSILLEAWQTKLDQEERVLFQAGNRSGSSNIKVLELPKEALAKLTRSICIGKLDAMWQDHLVALDHLRTEVSLRVVGQKDPLQEYKHEAFELFRDLIFSVQASTLASLLGFHIGHTALGSSFIPSGIRVKQEESLRKRKGNPSGQEKRGSKAASMPFPREKVPPMPFLDLSLLDEKD
jgi:preprotein translocase subunit SecA